MWPRRKKRGREQVLRAYRQRRAQAGEPLLDAEPIVGADRVSARRASRRARGQRQTVSRGGALQGSRFRGALGIAAALSQGWRSVPSRPFAATFSLFLALAVAFIGLSGRYRVQGASAQVTGNSRLSAAEVVAASGIDGQNIFTLDPDSVARALSEHADIKEARIASALPALVAIEIVESEVVLLLDRAGTRVGVDEQGRIVALPRDDAERPVIRDDAGRLAPNGVAVSAELFEAALRYGEHFRVLDYREQEGFVGRTEEGWPVRLGGDASMSSSQIARLNALLPQLRDGARAVEVIDLRYDSRPYYRLQGETP